MRKFELLFPDWIQLLIEFLCFYLIWECLRMGNIWLGSGDWFDTVFLIVAFVFLVFRIQKRWALPLLFVATFLLAYWQRWLLTEEDFYFWEDIFQSLKILATHSGEEVLPAFSLLFYFWLLLLFVLLAHYWVCVKKRAFFFVLSVLVLLAALDTFSEFDGEVVIVRIFLVSMTLLAVAHWQRYSHRDGGGAHASSRWRWAIPFVLFLLIGLVMGLTLEKHAATWADPIAFLGKRLGSGTGSSVEKVQGFGTEASELGGDFLPDNQLVFTARDEKRHYWKMENRSIYTGKGWELYLLDNSELGADERGQIHFISGEVTELVPLGGYQQSEEAEWSRASIELASPLAYLPVPALPTMIRVEVPADGAVSASTFDRLNHQVRAAQGDFQKASFFYQKQAVDVDVLKKITLIGAEDEASWQTIYASVPSFDQVNRTLPESGDLYRVATLTKEITAEQETDFEKVAAIVDYLRSGEFRYAQKGIPIPDEGQDYVAQFLFETKRGYCDNFSSAFVVMCRTLGIEARWVRGYTGGDYQGSEEGQNVYQVTNQEAHSWGEVYFPGIGWIPFEPTPTFEGAVQFVRASGQGDGYSFELPEVKEELEREKSSTTAKETEAADVSRELSGVWNSPLDWGLLGGIVLLLVSLVAYWKRKYWLPYVWFFWFERRKEGNDFERAYLVLLKQLMVCGYRRETGMTLRAYADWIDQALQSEMLMKRLTEVYELHLYRKPVDAMEWAKWYEDWRQMMSLTIQQ